jgi:hypothetical protein
MAESFEELGFRRSLEWAHCRAFMEQVGAGGDDDLAVREAL